MNPAWLVWRQVKKAGLALPATLIKVTQGTPTPGNLIGGTNPTETSYTCDGLIEAYTALELTNTLIQANDRKIVLFGASLFVTPATDDKVTIDGNTYRIIAVARDTLKAMWTLQARMIA